MTVTERILTYASMQGQPFRKRDLLDSLGIQIISKATANVLLSRLFEQGKLVKVGHGLYSLPEKGKHSFIYMPSEDEKELARIIKEKFPFAEFCVWKPSVLIPYMRHIPVLGMTFVDVERTAMESVFFFLQGAAFEMPILLNPTSLEIERYITTNKVLIVRPLINEAPLTFVENTPVPTLEKILVDTAGDRELSFAQGAELFTIFENAFSMHDINVSRLLRYASRRNRKVQILKIINTQKS